jgi:hypothetical protein
MTTIVKGPESIQKAEYFKGMSPEIQKGVENHKKAAAHHEAAAKHHHEAARHHEEGNHEKAYQSTLMAHGHHIMAGERQREDLRHHTLKQEITNQ